MTCDNIIHVDFASRMGRRFVPVRAPEDAAESARDPERDPLGDLYSLRDAAKLFHLSESRLRYWEKNEFIVRSGEHGGRRYYTFQDLIGIRAARELLNEGVALRNVHKSLRALRESLPRVMRPLSSLRIVADGQSLVVRDDRGSYDPLTGQLVLDFAVTSLRDDVVRVLKRNGQENQYRQAYEAYLEGCRLDESEATFDAAEAAYRRAIELDPTLANALTNLGNLMFKRDRLDEAEVLYVRALKLDAEQPEAHYNLGFLLFDRGDAAAAIESFERALSSDPAFADAHFNLAMALQELGRTEEARPHWETYLKLDHDSQWAEIARRHLRSHA
ncbi:MAG: tetratricopeptide repeat protein [Polyangiales bacterium]